MESPLISPHFSEDLLPIPFNLWDETNSALNPCWKAPQFSTSPCSIWDPDGVQAGKTILLFGFIGIVFFLVFMITLLLIFMVNLLWLKRMKKVIKSWGQPVPSFTSFPGSIVIVDNVLCKHLWDIFIFGRWKFILIGRQPFLTVKKLLEKNFIDFQKFPFQHIFQKIVL